MRTPLGPYLRYECEWGYAYNVRAGEDIRILDLAEASEPPGLVDHDFWLVDEDLVVLIYYDDTGRFLGGEALPRDGDATLCCRTRCRLGRRDPVRPDDELGRIVAIRGERQLLLDTDRQFVLFKADGALLAGYEWVHAAKQEHERRTGKRSWLRRTLRLKWRGFVMKMVKRRNHLLRQA